MLGSSALSWRTKLAPRGWDMVNIPLGLRLWHAAVVVATFCRWLVGGWKKEGGRV